ncbi:MAG: NAD(P)H-dependent oxidoreductase [Cyanobacteria bacterium P01_C01_bin.72]
MAYILRIDSSSRIANSHSRQLADHFQTTWLEKYPEDQVVVRDLAKTPLPHLTDLAIAGFYTPPEQQSPAMKTETALSDQLIAELQGADTLLLSVPMYNFSVPSALKAWIDQIVRIGETFAYDGTNFTGLVKVKRAYIICAYGAGGYLQGGSFAGFNFLEPYLQGLFSFLGIKEIEFFHLQGTTGDAKAIAANTEQTQQTISQTISSL